MPWPDSCERASRRTVNGMSPAEMAQMLGNSVCEDDDNACSEETELVHELQPSAVALLSVLERDDHAVALEAVRAASPRDINACDELGRNALLLAAAEGHEDACEALLAREDFRGASASTTIGACALHLAAGNGHVGVCHVLLTCERFALGVNALTTNGRTPLDFALDFGDGTAAQVIREAGGERSGREPRSRMVAQPRRGGIPEEEAGSDGSNGNRMDDLD
eukprot:NODE_14679_length_1093_cov_5.690476.p1 GENE.NODE_14679_length_1093_cov_5.690476~~NODE_14679_length_1093_cov_5.690476.p1  ORF type:complete len:222 (+),score=54.94 NODE_14679_length_1093_cov_5.690476:222-887(+)